MPESVPPEKMHADEVDIDVVLVARLIAAQFPAWAELPLEHVPSAGTDNALYRLGEDKVVRLPRTRSAVRNVDKEQRWLPRLAPQLPIAIPAVLASGEPAEGYPWRWSVYRWIDGENPEVGRIADPASLARGLAAFVSALHRAPHADDAPAGRGVPLERRDEFTRTAIEALRGRIDTEAVSAVWDAALRAPAWSEPRAWTHGDLSPFNVLLRTGRLGAVIDFGTLGVGDPAVDLIAAWNLLPVESRPVYRAALQVDDATWGRGRALALSIALIQLPYYWDTNPSLAANARHVIGEILADHVASGTV